MVDQGRFGDKLFFKYKTDWIKDDNGHDVPVKKPKLEVIFRKYSESKDIKRNPEWRGFALVDSGADFSSMPLQVAKILQLEFEEKKGKLLTISGITEVYQSTIFLEVMNKMMPIKIGTVEVRIPDQEVLEENIEKMIILGRKDFFDKFEITFNESAKTFLLKKIHPERKF